MAATVAAVPARILLDGARRNPFKSLDLRNVHQGQMILVRFGTVPNEASVSFRVVTPARREVAGLGYVRIQLQDIDMLGPFGDQLRCNGARDPIGAQGAIVGMRVSAGLHKHRIVTGWPLRWSLYLRGRGECFFEVPSLVTEWQLLSR